MGQSARTRPNFVDCFAPERTGNRGDSSEELAVEDEILAQRLAGLEAVAGDDVTQGLGAGPLLA